MAKRLLRSPLLRMIYFVLLLLFFSAIALWIVNLTQVPANNLKTCLLYTSRCV